MTTHNPIVPDVDPRGQGFVDTFNDRRWLAYFANLLPRFENVRFLALGVKDVPDVALHRLYVPLQLGPQYIPPQRIDEVGQDETLSVAQALAQRRYLVVLGDPGSGKSTLTSHLATIFASRFRHPLVEEFGRLIPLPFVLREYEITQDLTFDHLLDQFMGLPYWNAELGRDDLHAALERGQALVLLDGLDEISDLGRREALRSAVLHGVSRFCHSRWLLTSRIVGYEDAPFRLDPSNERPDPELEALVSERLYVLPFTSAQIRAFATHWYEVRERDAVARKDGVESLVEAIAASPSLAPLAHTPNLLTMIALVHRVYAQLPSGRGMLYDRITEAYLESIDTLRGIHGSAQPVSRHRQWLGSLAYGLQEKRAAGRDAREIHVRKEDVEAEIQAALGPEHDAGLELHYVARRSGLLVPRKPGTFTFVHLSFQEYFAAHYLYEGLMSFDQRDETAGIIEGLVENPLWHETLTFLFEAVSKHAGSSDWLLARLLRPEPTPAQALLASELLADLDSGLGEESQRAGCAAVLGSVRKKAADEALRGRIERLPPEVWQGAFLPAVATEIEASMLPNAELLLFLQQLPALDGEWLEGRLAAGPLRRLAVEDLYYLFPLASERSGPIRHEMVRRLPVELWVGQTDDGFSPVQGLLESRLDWQGLQRQDWLAWLGAVALVLDALLFKGWVVASDDAEESLSLSRSRSVSRSLSLSRSVSRSLSLSRSRSLSLFLQDHPNSLVQTVRAVLAGDDDFRIKPPDPVLRILRSPSAVLGHLSQLLLGRGGRGAWESVLREAEGLREQGWARRDLRLLEAGEMARALDLLGLGRTPLFEPEWFTPTHPLGRGLNARPGELVAALRRREEAG